MSASILVVDDEKCILESVKSSLSYGEEFAIDTASNHKEVFFKIREKAYDVIVMDVFLPDINGLELIKHIKNISPSFPPAFVVITGHGDMEMAIQAVRLEVSDFLKKPFERNELIYSINKILARRARGNEFSGRFHGSGEENAPGFNNFGLNLENPEEMLVMMMAEGIDNKSMFTSGHSIRVSEISRKIGEKLNMGEEELKALRIGGMLHNIGYIGIPEGMLNQTDLLDGTESDLIRLHPWIGYEILKPVLIARNCLSIVLSHHERWDGEGYPEGLSGSGIPLGARIVGLAEAFDAMLSLRPHREPVSWELAKMKILKGRKSQFDPLCVDILLDHFDSIRDHINSFPFQRRALDASKGNLNKGTPKPVLELFKDLITQNTNTNAISNLCQKTYDLDKSNRILKSIIEKKDDLVNMIVHDMRGLLTGIATNAELLDMYGEKALRGGCVEDILKCANKLEVFVSDLLDVNKMENGRINLFLDHLNLHKLIEELLHLKSLFINRHKIKIDINIPQDCGQIYGDYRIVQRIIDNLITNAIEHMDKEEGCISVDYIFNIEQKGHEILVKDTGPGIPGELRGKIFDKFFSSGLKRGKKKGTGLGLAFCKMAVENHGGSINVESKVGEGSCFKIFLPGCKEKQLSEPI